MPANFPSDEMLLDLVKAGDLDSFNVLFERYWEGLYATVFSVCKDNEVCADIVHDIFLNLWIRRKKLQINYFKGYITASARYHVYRYLKREKRKNLEYKEELDSVSLVILNDGERNIRYRELEKKVEEELEVLPSRCRQIFTMSRIQQLTNDEIAKQLDISKRTVENQLTYALRHLRLSIRHFMIFIYLLHF